MKMRILRRPLENKGSLAFLSGLGLAVAVSLISEASFVASSEQILRKPIQSADLVPLEPRTLSEEDLSTAKVAWRYFEANYREETGLVDSVAGFPSTTLWDQGSYLLGLLSARELDLIDVEQFEYRTTALLEALDRLELFEGKLPNKVYQTTSLNMVHYDNTPSPEGIGWSALDVARMLMALRVLEIKHPERGLQIRAILSKWDLAAMTQQGRLIGASRTGGETRYLQEGRIGYEQYAARAAALWGLDVLEASSSAPILEWQQVESLLVPVDVRSSKSFGAITPTLSEPYLLQAFELGLNAEGALFAARIYAAQAARFANTGQLTMVTEDNIDRKPHFLYSSVFGNGDPWAVLTEKGDRHDALRTISLKATIGWDAIYDTEYTQLARNQLADLKRQNGWAAGKYETDGSANEIVTLNTNAVILEAMHFVAHGPLANY